MEFTHEYALLFVVALPAVTVTLLNVALAITSRPVSVKKSRSAVR